MTTDYQKEIETILEKTCGIACANGAEDNKPALPKLMALLQQSNRRTEEVVRNEFVKEKRLHGGIDHGCPTCGWSNLI